MKRIYYGHMAIDVADAVADVLLGVGTAAANVVESEPVSSVSQVPRGVAVAKKDVPFAKGTSLRVEFSGYVNDGPEAVVELVLGTGIPIAAASHYPAKPDPSTTVADRDGLRKTLDELLRPTA